MSTVLFRSISFGSVERARGRGFSNLDGDELGQSGLECSVQPDGQNLRRRVLEAGDIVETTVVELLTNGCEGRRHLGKIAHPPLGGLQRPAQTQLDAVTMSVQTGAFVPGRGVGKTVRAFEMERLVDQASLGHGPPELRIRSGKRASPRANVRRRRKEQYGHLPR